MYTDKLNLYKEVVVNAYFQKRAKGEDDWLNRLTRDRIRRQCSQKIENGLERRDERTLHRFLEMDLTDADYLTAIRDTDGDDFQGFKNFLDNPGIKTSQENVELLAWLIDFPDRPYSKYLDAGKDRPDISEEEEVVPPTTDQDEETRQPQKSTPPEIRPTPPPVNRKVWRWLLGPAGLLIGALVWWLLPQDNKCMYWDNDHYVATSCSVPRLDTPLIAFDGAKLRGFRRIKRVDTLTGYSVGRLWWARVGDSIEVFTAEGRHPLHPDKKLKKVTDYVVNFCRNRRDGGK